ncbi:hypothetical protein [Actinoplanes friuliensis]|jgi:hypothetical protein|uniref:Uncharacterized protein n=1 Tax=Actinoplanes friuliensis DSM 7358 TaxID=1246995 RepID=U5VUB4_9ACTN|nr:hypothetical protein [Actinoplanes friuliensis]AGZ39226.1 hypothetical protein AFR_04685 [Actinoplanes friuliensis DSM 7358]
MGYELRDFLWAETRREQPDLPESPWAEGLTSDDRRQAWLALLAALTTAEREVARLATVAAERAAEHGADYPDLGAAAGMTRQGARRRWPGLSRRGLRGQRTRMSDVATDRRLAADPVNLAADKV